MSAMDEVLATTELLENILLHLPMHDLLFAQHVSHHFQTLITESPTLQEALFFRPSKRITTESMMDTTHRLNPLLRDKFKPFFASSDIYLGLSKAQDFAMLPWKASDGTALVFLRKRASWRRMLVAQPPIRSLQIWQFSAKHEQDKVMRGSISFLPNDGLRMGTLYDHTERRIVYRLSHNVAGGGLVAQPFAFGLIWRPATLEDYVVYPIYSGIDIISLGSPRENFDESFERGVQLQEGTLPIVFYHGDHVRHVPSPRDWWKAFQRNGVQYPCIEFEDLTDLMQHPHGNWARSLFGFDDIKSSSLVLRDQRDRMDRVQRLLDEELMGRDENSTAAESENVSDAVLGAEQQMILPVRHSYVRN